MNVVEDKKIHVLICANEVGLLVVASGVHKLLLENLRRYEHDVHGRLRLAKACGNGYGEVRLADAAGAINKAGVERRLAWVGGYAQSNGAGKFVAAPFNKILKGEKRRKCGRGREERLRAGRGLCADSGYLRRGNSDFLRHVFLLLQQ